MFIEDQNICKHTGSFWERKRCVRVAGGAAETNASFLSALQTFQSDVIGKFLGFYEMKEKFIGHATGAVRRNPNTGISSKARRRQ